MIRGLIATLLQLAALPESGQICPVPAGLGTEPYPTPAMASECDQRRARSEYMFQHGRATHYATIAAGFRAGNLVYGPTPSPAR